MRPIAAIGALGGALMGLNGCAGTSPNLSMPQMQTPTLGQAGLAARSVAGAAPGAAAEASLPALEPVKTPEKTFVTLPYLQLGDAPIAQKKESLALLWHAAPGGTDWSVEVRPARGGNWKPIESKPTVRTIALEGVESHALWSASLTNLEPGKLFDYRVLKAGTPVFAARARPRRSAREAYRFVVVGDTGARAEPPTKVAQQMGLARPDFVFHTGNLAPKGRSGGYAEGFWPVFNSEASGAALLRSVPFVATPGEDDVAGRNLDETPDGLAYFYYWSQPRNGPVTKLGLIASGSEARRQAFTAAAGDAYPRTANYSFDYGNAHWTVLDSGRHTDWDDAALRAWLEKDLAAAKGATWRFVAFHHPPFHSSKSYDEEQWMRRLAPLFEKYGVAIVWSGRVRNYQRSHPLAFAPGKPVDKDGRVEGKWTLDSAFDGVKKTRPTGVIYVVSGAGGSDLVDKDRAATPKEWQPFTKAFVADVHSLTVVDVQDRKLTVKQVSAEGKEVDAFTVTK